MMLVAVNNGASMMWVADVPGWRRVLQERAWAATPHGTEWVWEEPDLGEHRCAYDEVCEAYGGPVRWWVDLSDEEREDMPEFRHRPDLGRGCWLAPFGPSEE